MISLDSLILPPELLWSDEFAWAGAALTSKRTLQGKMFVQASAIPGDSGRLITLGNEHAWIPRADLLTLQAWSSQAGLEMLLRLHDGRGFQVIWRLWDAPVLEAEQVWPIQDPTSDSLYHLKALKLVVV